MSQFWPLGDQFYSEWKVYRNSRLISNYWVNKQGVMFPAARPLMAGIGTGTPRDPWSGPSSKMDECTKVFLFSIPLIFRGKCNFISLLFVKFSPWYFSYCLIVKKINNKLCDETLNSKLFDETNFSLKLIDPTGDVYKVWKRSTTR